jgi:hypothetical protein
LSGVKVANIPQETCIASELVYDRFNEYLIFKHATCIYVLLQNVLFPEELSRDELICIQLCRSLFVCNANIGAYPAPQEKVVTQYDIKGGGKTNRWARATTLYFCASRFRPSIIDIHFSCCFVKSPADHQEHIQT